jgi:hypothetical protein
VRLLRSPKHHPRSTLTPDALIVRNNFLRPQGTNIGRIKRLMIEKMSGRAAYAIISFGGFLGMATEEHAIPWNKRGGGAQLWDMPQLA